MQLDLLAELNRDHLSEVGPNLDLEGRLDSFELAFLMQAAIPEIRSLAGESHSTLRAHGLDDPVTAHFGRQCLLAWQFAGQGVRFVQVTHSDSYVQWDRHTELKGRAREECPVGPQTDRGPATRPEEPGTPPGHAGPLGWRVRPNAHHQGHGRPRS
jgi:hypothetical protein